MFFSSFIQKELAKFAAQQLQSDDLNYFIILLLAISLISYFIYLGHFVSFVQIRLPLKFKI